MARASVVFRELSEVLKMSELTINGEKCKIRTEVADCLSYMSEDKIQFPAQKQSLEAYSSRKKK